MTLLHEYKDRATEQNRKPKNKQNTFGDLIFGMNGFLN